MNARRILALSLGVALTAASAAQAAPGTNKSLGVYNRGGWESGGVARSRMSYSYRAPAAYSAPVVQSAPEAPVAQAPAESRRFSYEPSVPAATSVPCPQAPAAAAAPTVQGERRYSYAPAPEATTPSAQPAAPTYYSRPSYSGGSRSRSTVDLWALPKTHPQKYNSR